MGGGGRLGHEAPTGAASREGGAADTRSVRIVARDRRFRGAGERAAGIAPLAFQGKYPTYAWSTLLSVYQRLVPFEKFYEMQDLKPGDAPGFGSGANDPTAFLTSWRMA